jgi:RND family efflux transporter MFP subunit
MSTTSFREPLLVIAISTCLALLSACSRSDAAPEKSTAPAEAVPIVPVAKVGRADLASDLTLTAEFEPYQQIDVMAKVAGYVQLINVDIGDRVHKDQVLATLEIPEMEDELAKAAASIDQAEAEIVTASDELKRAQAAHELAHISYTRIGDVIKKEPGLVPQQEVDEARSRDLVAEAQVSAATSSLRTAEQKARVARADQSRLQTLHKYTSIPAPFEGVVTKRYANAGSMIQAGTASQTQAMPIVQLSQNNLLRLILPVPESVVPRIHVGETLDVKVSSLGKTFPGRVERFADKIQESTRTMDTEVDVPNPTLTLIPGMYAEVTLRLDGRDHALALPIDAVDRSGPSPRVYSVTPAGVIHIVPVSLGLETDQWIEVRSGIEQGDTVVVGRLAGLLEGEPVQIRPDSAPPVRAGIGEAQVH